MPYVNTNGIQIHYELHGEENKEVLILVSGWTLKKEMWIAQVSAFEKYYKVLTFDNRGVGKSDRPDMPYTMELFADDLAGLMDALEIDKAHMMGYALGGMYLQKFALKYPERLKKLILLNTVASFPDDEGVENVKNINIKALSFQQNAPNKYFMRSAKMAFHRSFIKELEANPDKKFHNLWKVEDITKEYNIDPQTPKDVENQGNAMLGFNLLDQISEIENETLIIAASHNRLHPKAAMEAMHEKMPNSQFEVIKKAGDSDYLSRAPEINELVLNFLAD